MRGVTLAAAVLLVVLAGHLAFMASPVHGTHLAHEAHALESSAAPQPHAAACHHACARGARHAGRAAAPHPAPEDCALEAAPTPAASGPAQADRCVAAAVYPRPSTARLPALVRVRTVSPPWSGTAARIFLHTFRN